MRTRTWLLLGLMLCFYWAISLDRLATYPLVGQDEPWIAAAPYKLATEGVFGSDLWAGYHGLEERHYQHLPAFHLLQAALFRLAGVGVFQMRFLPVTLGLLVLPLAFAVGRQLGGAGLGLLAVALLCVLRLSGDPAASGIPLLDIARVNRYDVGVPVFGLAALWLFNRAEKSGALQTYAASGAASGVAGLFHMYGLFWLPAFLSILLYRKGLPLWRQRAPYALLGAALLVWSPWLVYVAAGWQDYVGQQRFIADRFDLFSARFYLENVVHEIDRYRTIDLFDAAGRPQLARPGLWITLLGLPPAVLLLWRSRKPSAASLALALLVHAALFALLLKQKHYNYMIALWPLALLALAAGGAWLWRHKYGKPALLVLLALTAIEGLAGTVQRQRLAARVTPYNTYTARVAQHIPPEALVLGLQHYWLGLRQYPYRTWLLPLFMADPRLYEEQLTLDEALERVDPDVILIDRHIRPLLTRSEAADQARTDQFWRFMERRGAALVGVVEDGDYGRMEVYLVPGAVEEGR